MKEGKVTGFERWETLVTFQDIFLQETQERNTYNMCNASK